ncbi:MAG: aminotransferase class I/II-fold pyridoxal phosphate-dependent enzyme [Saprospiraceae bacterium]|jgi:glycine C-acetyltransferase|nr:aminotransferase class I/II-fold pyridoxal phosphate-dependent enzyme [Saprospiraceae bacterium]
MDLFDRLKSSDMGSLGRYSEEADGYYMFPKLEGELGPRMKFHGREIINWSINNYLGLANHPEIREADAKASAEWGLAYPMGARMMSGNTEKHEQLERELAAFVHKEKSILLNFGYQGVSSAIDCLVNRHDVIVYDSESHACIIDGVRLHLGKRFAFDHNNIDSLRTNLLRANKIIETTGGSILVISEGVFGMRGDQGILKEIVELKKEFQFRLFVDDAHGFGTLGPNGEGAGVEQGIQDEIDIYFATFAKSMASIGAFIASEKFVVDYIRFNIRSQIFAKSMPMPLVVGNLKRLDMIRNSPELKNKLWDNVNYLQGGLKERGFDIGSTNSCVTPVYLKGSIEEAMVLVYDLRENFGIFCSMVVYPVIPKGMIILRLIPTAAHSKIDIDETLDAFMGIKDKLYNGEYKRIAEEKYVAKA